MDINDLIKDINNQTAKGIDEIVKDIINHYAYITGEEIPQELTEEAPGGETDDRANVRERHIWWYWFAFSLMIFF